MTKHKPIVLQNGLNDLKLGLKFFDALIQKLGESLYEEVDFDNDQDNIDFALDVTSRFRSKVAESLYNDADKIVIELSDQELKIITRKELEQMKIEARKFDGFEGWIVRGKLI